MCTGVQPRACAMPNAHVRAGGRGASCTTKPLHARIPPCPAVPEAAFGAKGRAIPPAVIWGAAFMSARADFGSLRSPLKTPVLSGVGHPKQVLWGVCNGAPMVFLVLWDAFDLKQPKFSWGAGGHFGSVVRGSLDPSLKGTLGMAYHGTICISSVRAGQKIASHALSSGCSGGGSFRVSCSLPTSTRSGLAAPVQIAGKFGSGREHTND